MRLIDMQSANQIADLAVCTEDLVKTYRGGVKALDRLSLSVERGTIFSILGPNGAGKSTTVRILTTLTRPSGGFASVAGFDVSSHRKEIRARIGYVPQRSSLDRELTGLQNLLLQGQLYGVDSQHLTRRASGLIERFSLEEFSRKPVRTYSGGVLRRFDIVAGLVHHPEILFLDEPTTGLDPESRRILWQYLTTLSAEGMTVVMTTHYLEEADALSNGIAIVDHGRVVIRGTPEQLKAEMRSDVIHLSVDSRLLDEFTVAKLMSLEGVDAVSTRDYVVLVRAPEGVRLLPSLISIIEKQGRKVTGISLSRPSLEDVYLFHTKQPAVALEQYQ